MKPSKPEKPTLGDTLKVPTVNRDAKTDPPPREPDVDASNRFGVRYVDDPVQGPQVLVEISPGRSYQFNPAEARLLAAWLVVTAGDADAFAKVLVAMRRA